NESEVDEFNRQMRVDIERIRDFVILHYKVTNRDDSRFWQYCKNMSVPQELAKRIQLFKESGRAFQIGGELFSEQSWTQVMLGQGIMPENYHPFVESLGDEQLISFLHDIRDSKGKKVMQFPTHQDFIRTHCLSRMGAWVVMTGVSRDYQRLEGSSEKVPHGVIGMFW